MLTAATPVENPCCSCELTRVLEAAGTLLTGLREAVEAGEQEIEEILVLAGEVHPDSPRRAACASTAAAADCLSCVSVRCSMDS